MLSSLAPQGVASVQRGQERRERRAIRAPIRRHSRCRHCLRHEFPRCRPSAVELVASAFESAFCRHASYLPAAFIFAAAHFWASVAAACVCARTLRSSTSSPFAVPDLSGIRAARKCSRSHHSPLRNDELVEKLATAGDENGLLQLFAATSHITRGFVGGGERDDVLSSDWT